MKEKDPLFEYIDLIRMVEEYLARGYAIVSTDYTLISFDKSAAFKKGVISLTEVYICDKLECIHYNELGSIMRIMEIVNEGDTEELKKNILPKISKQINLNLVPELYKKMYKTIKSRFRNLLNSIVLQLCTGLRVIPTDSDIEIIESENEDYNNQIEYFANIDGMEYQEDMEYSKKIEHVEENASEGIEQTVERPYLTYSITQKKFYLMYDGEILVEDVNVDLAMKIATKYLYRVEKERAFEKMNNEKNKKTELRYDGIHISIDDKELDEK